MIRTDILDNQVHRWSAVRRRERATGDSFVYAVRTTGVYCRPGCRSRQPRRENVVFFDSATAAERAGFRACRRCRPEVAGEFARHKDAVVRACRTIEAADAPPPLVELAAASGLSPPYFQRVFKRTIGLTPKQYALGLRTGRFGRALRGAGTVTQAVYEAGFGSSGRAYDGARDRLGMRPRAVQRGGRGETLRYATVESELGWVLVAATDAGVCLVELGDSEAGLRASLVDRFPKATTKPLGRDAARWAAAVARWVASPGTELKLPLDIRGTAFQLCVWQALRRIQPGQTRTYAEVAAVIGAPRAARAVARACATNRLALAVPCHRVVRGDGAPGGYRWGVVRKQKLLKRERAASGNGPG